MVDEVHLKVIMLGVKAWNDWRRSKPLFTPDFSGADLRGANLSGVDFGGANCSGANLNDTDLREADLRGADLSNAHLCRADLSRARLRDANLSWIHLNRARLLHASLRDADLCGADLSWARLRGADLQGADLRGADLRGADLKEADFSGADFSGAYLRKARLNGANLCRAYLCRAYLREADLRHAMCEQANFSNANLTLARLLSANLNNATLTESRLWETQHAGWSIKGVICESVYWDKDGKEVTAYGPGEFERLYVEKVKVLVRYPNGISPLEVVTLPALIQHLEASRPGCKLRLESIQDAPGGAVVTIVVENSEDTSLKQMSLLKAAIQSEAEQKAQYLRDALESEKESALLLKGEVQTLERMIDKLLSRPTYYLQGGDAIMGDEYNVGQGFAGQNVHAHDMTFNQIGGNIERSMDLSELSAELSKLRWAMSQEAKETSHHIALGEVAKAEEAAKAKDSSKVAENLKAAGKWALDIATKIGTSLATEAIKESMGLK